ncbi:KH domain-containing protein [Patescibacteria group bacterium]
MEDLLKYILEKLATKPDKVKIEKKEEGSEVIFNIDADDDDKGKIIGKGGGNIKAIRTILAIIARKEEKRVYLNVE